MPMYRQSTLREWNERYATIGKVSCNLPATSAIRMPETNRSTRMAENHQLPTTTVSPTVLGCSVVRKHTILSATWHCLKVSYAWGALISGYIGITFCGRPMAPLKARHVFRRNISATPILPTHGNADATTLLWSVPTFSTRQLMTTISCRNLDVLFLPSSDYSLTNH